MNIEQATSKVIERAVGRPDYTEVNEASLQHILGYKADGFCILSACRSDWSTDPDENDKTNREMTKRLAADIRDAGLGYVPCFGGYRESVANPDGTPMLDENGNQVMRDVFEQSFVVPCYNQRGQHIPFGELERKCLELAGKYRQETITTYPPNDVAHWAVATPTDGHEVGDYVMDFKGGETLNDVMQTYFTALNRKSAFDRDNFGKNPRRVSFHESCGDHANRTLRFNEGFRTLNGGHARYLKGEICRAYNR
jgi:hypothetical protein